MPSENPGEEIEIETETIALDLAVETILFPAFEKPLVVQDRDVRLLTSPPWVRSLGKLTLEVSTQGWRFPTPPEPSTKERPALRIAPEPEEPAEPAAQATPPRTRLLPPRDTVMFKDRLLYLLQPSLENLFA